ncbi:hypothetical protein TAMA11512_09220 [Selenomonas sp. TAMA-11512]|nr:hypothetical protein TAMA11512_09220 [Selenomonas sp. TAMA-11512]
MAAAIGQVTKVLAQRQDDMDAADVMKARNEMMTSLTEQLYGENGLFTTGVGENAKGLMQRTTDAINKTYEDVSKNYNGRVRYALKGNLSENMANFQRIAASKEMAEGKEVAAATFSANLASNVQQAGLTWQVKGSPELYIKNNDVLLQARAKSEGWSGAQYSAARRSMVSDVVSAVVSAAMESEDYETAASTLREHRSEMEQADYWKYQKEINRKQRAKDMDTEAREIFNMPGVWDGKRFNKAKAFEYIDERYGQNVTKGIAGGVGWSGDAGIDSEINDAAQEFGVDPALVAAIASVETNGYDQSAVSYVGARGIMQLMPGTAAGLGVNPDDRRDNIRGGAKYLQGLLKEFGGDIRLAAAAYNAGPQAVKDAGGVPNYAETKAYVEKVQKAYEENKRKSASGGGNALGVTPYDMGTQNGISKDRLQPKWKDGVLGTIGGVLKDVFGVTGVISSTGRTREHNWEVGGVENSKHIDDGNGGDAVDIVLPDGVDKAAIVEYFKSTGAFKEVLFHNVTTGEHLHLGEYRGGLGSGGSRTVSAYDPEKRDRMMKLVSAIGDDYESAYKEQRNQYFDGILQAAQDAGSYSGAISILNGQDLTMQERNHLENAITAYYKPNAKKSGGSDGSYKPTADKVRSAYVTMQKFEARLQTDGKVSTDQLISYRAAADVLQAEGYLDEEYENILNDQATWSKITDAMESPKGGILKAQQALIGAGLDPLTALAVLSRVDVRMTPAFYPEEDEEEEEQ